LDALAIYGADGGDGGSGDKPDTPVKPKEELVSELEETLEATETFLLDEVNFDLHELIKADGLHKLAAIEKAINAVYTNDETKRKYQILARAVFKKYKALQPDKVLHQYAPRKNAIDVIYTAIEDNVESADVADIMVRIQQVIDGYITVLVSEPTLSPDKIIDLSGLNFVLLEQYFTKTKNKNAAVQSLKDKIEKQLKHMVERNPLLVDYYQRYQEIIDAYNHGKDEVVIQDTFRKLIELINSLTQEEAETKREGLSDEQKAIFDILRHGKVLEKEEKAEIKKISVELLDELKKEKLQVEQVWDKAPTSAAIYNYVNKTLFEVLPYPTYQNDDIDVMTNLVYEHLKSQYYGGGNSVYGRY
jgi:type I restriction enzyme R subunit